MRLRNITVKRLFGIFDHEIPLDKPDGVTIIHGPNGFGKTVMLKMIAAAFQNDSTIFRNIPFSEFSMEFVDGTVWKIMREYVKKRKSARGPRPECDLKVTNIDPAGSTTEMAISEAYEPGFLRAIDSHVPPPYHLASGGWTDDTGQVYSADQILTMFPQARAMLPPHYGAKLHSSNWGPPELPVFVVETNRLDSARPLSQSEIRTSLSRYGRAELQPELLLRPLRVQQYSADVVQRIKSVLADYAKSSQERDRTFPERLVKFIREEKDTLGERVILEQMQELEKKRQRLIALGFLDSETGLRDLTEEDVRKAREALTIYVGDVQAKLSAFDEMAERIGKLIDVVNDRFDYKNLKIHRENGFQVVSSVGDKIQLNDLSSGEQHELVILYELLFRTPKSGLILVDEPEISLHVAWQSRFLSDLIDILKLNDAYAVVATHSPVVIGTQWDLTKELEGPPLAPTHEK